MFLILTSSLLHRDQELWSFYSAEKDLVMMKILILHLVNCLRRNIKFDLSLINSDGILYDDADDYDYVTISQFRLFQVWLNSLMMEQLLHATLFMMVIYPQRVPKDIFSTMNGLVLPISGNTSHLMPSETTLV